MNKEVNTEMPDYLFNICIAYEQGFGKGFDFTKCANPYILLSDPWWAWDYGFSEGARKKTNSMLEKKDISEVIPGTQEALDKLSIKTK